MKSLFAYSWTIDSHIHTHTVIRIWGLNKCNKNICLKIEDFNPYMYIELPNLNFEWKTRVGLIYRKIDEICNYSNISKPISKELVHKRKLYYNQPQLSDFILLHFPVQDDIKKLSWKLKYPFKISRISSEKIKLKPHEHNANSILQLTCSQNIPTAGWIKFKENPIKESETYCFKEYKSSYKSLLSKNCNIVPTPLILSFDIEVNSSNINMFPSAKKKDDKVFQISCIFNHQGNTNYDNILLTLGNPTQNKLKNITVLSFKTEKKLLLGFVNLVIKRNPQLIIGYNILSFDIPYMIDRATLCNIDYEFSQLGCIKYHKSNIQNIKWSSSAYKNQEFKFIDAEGRVFIDLLPIIKRDYKFNNYKLKTVSTFFIGETKDPLTPQDIFKCYRKGMKNDKKGQNALALVGKYCIQDSVLVTKIFEEIQTWIGLCEMAKTCNVPMVYLFTRGQQIKVFSQVYKYCKYSYFIVENEGYIPKENEEYTGATVFPPIPGAYDKVIPFDFASLYPTTIIAYNIDYSTLVDDNISNNILDDDCHIIEWEDHVGCEHDTTIRKTKVNKVICETNRKYRFLKKPKGVIPTLLENLLTTRKNTKTEMKELKKLLKGFSGTDDELYKLKTNITVLDKRQLSYKVSANSMYGAMGVKRGYLPFLPGAMCTTAKGRQSIEKAAKTIQEDFNGKLIYGDTDSCYINFPHLKTSEECWDYALDVEEKVSNLFPRPMKLEFEEVIYWRYFILSKKRYMALSCGRDGILKINKQGEHEIEKKGVLLARRDNSQFIRDLYENIVMKIFNKLTKDDVLYELICNFNKLCYMGFYANNFIITKSVGAIDDYKIKSLSDDNKKRMKRLQDLEIFLHDPLDYTNHAFSPNNCTKCKQEYELYKIRCLPAHIQLAEKIKKRGTFIEVGSRIEYVITKNGGVDGKQFKKIEDPEYQRKYYEYVKLDYLYYLKMSSNSLDQLLEVAYNLKNFTLKQFKFRVKRQKLLEEIKSFSINDETSNDNYNYTIQKYTNTNKKLIIYKQNLKFLLF